MPVSVGYETDLDVIFPLLEEATAKVPRVSQSKPPSATLVRFGADGLDVQVGFWIADPENGTRRREVECEPRHLAHLAGT